jgi:tetratricopeptide (TPR) repeat protein
MVRLGVALLAAVCLIIPLRTHAQRSVAIAGNVYFGDESHPAANVPVYLDNSEQEQFANELTNDSGQFRFSGLKPSLYALKIDVSGYESANLSLDMSFFSDKGLKIVLRPISGKQDSGKRATVSVHELSMPPKARALMESGKKKLYQDKDSAGGLADFLQAISIAPGYYEAYYQAGMDYLSLGNRQEAEKSFQKSVQVSGDKYGEADIGLGAVMLDLGIPTDAEKSIRRGLQINPNLWLGHYELGRALLNLKRFSDAELSADQARLLAPTAPVVYRLLSNIHLAQKNYPALFEDIDAYLKLDPDSPAGVRAKQLREQLQQKLSAEDVDPASAKP